MRHLTHVSWPLANQTFVSACNFLAGVILVRSLGLSQFGIFTFLYAAILLANVVQNSMLVAPMMTIGPKIGVAEERAIYYNQVFTYQLVYNVVSSFTLFLVTVVFAAASQNTIHVSTAVAFSAAAAAFALQDFLRRMLFAVVAPAWAFATDSISYGGQVVALAALGALGWLTVTSSFWVVAVTSALAAVLATIRVRPVLLPNRETLRVLRRQMQSGGWMLGSNMLQWLSSQGVLLLAGSVLGAATLGAIRAVINILGPVNILFLASQNFMPRYASVIYVLNGRSGLLRGLVRAALVFGGITLLAGLAASWFAQPLLAAVYSREVATYWRLVPWQAAYLVVGGAILPLTYYFRTTEWTRPLAIGAAYAAATSTLLAYILLPRLGPTGYFAAVGMGQLALGLVLGLSLAQHEKSGAANAFG